MTDDPTGFEARHREELVLDFVHGLQEFRVVAGMSYLSSMLAAPDPFGCCQSIDPRLQRNS
jgi:hypothetical protein